MKFSWCDDLFTRNICGLPGSISKLHQNCYHDHADNFDTSCKSNPIMLEALRYNIVSDMGYSSSGVTNLQNFKS